MKDYGAIVRIGIQWGIGILRLRKTELGVVLLLIFCANASATTYYVSSSAGNDGNSGTSSSAAWRTIAHVNGQSFQPGDSILFKRGDVWNESLAPASSGSSGNPITFDAYGSGAAPTLTGYYAVPATAWVLVTGNAWKAPLPATYTNINFCLFGSVWGQKVVAASSNLTAQWDFYLANGYVYVYSIGNPGSYYNAPIVPMALSNTPVININGESWLTFQHFLVNWFDEYGVYVQGTSDHLVFANMEADSMIPQGTQPLGFYVDESAPGPGDIKIYNAEAHLNYDGFRFDGTASAITMVNDKAYANRDGALVDNTGAVTYSYCHFYASSLAVAGSTDVEWTSGNGPLAGAGNIAADTAPAVQVYERYPAEVTLTVDDAGMTAGADSYYAGTVLPVADAAGVAVGVAVTVGYPLAQTLVSEFQGWVNAGRDVSSHSMSHTYYTNTDALEIQYTGSGTAATLSISNKTLTIAVTGASDGVTYNLAQGGAEGTMLGLAEALAATGKFTYSFLTPCQGPYGTGCSAYTAAALLAQDLADVSSVDVKTAIYHMQLDVTRLTTDEITLSRQWMTTNLTGLPATPVYVYPGGYETTTMQGITASTPYTGARGALKEDLGVKDTYADGFNVQNITSFGVNPSWMGLAPAVLNQKIQALVWKESVWGVPWGIFWHLNELTNSDPVGGTEITNLIQDFKNGGATIQTNTGLVNWLLSGTQEIGTDGNYYYKSAATSMALDLRPTRNSPVVDAGQNLGTAYEFDINGVNQNTYGSGWEIGAHVYEDYAVYGGQTGSYFVVGAGGTTNCGSEFYPCSAVQLPLTWVNNTEWQGTTGDAINFPSAGTGGSWVCGSTNYGPYVAGSQTSAQQAIDDAESCRVATGTGTTITFPAGALYSGSSGLSLPQTAGDTSTNFIVLTSSAPLSTSQTVCSHGEQDNVVESTQPGLRNPFCDGTQMSYQNGTSTITNLYTSTTSTASVSAGSAKYLAVGSVTGMTAGATLGIDLAGAHEAVTMTSVLPSGPCNSLPSPCIVANFANAHASGAMVTIPIGAFTLANGRSANTSNYNDVASMWGIQYTGETQGLSCGVGGDGSPCHNYTVVNAHIFPTPCTYVPGSSPNCTGGNTTTLSHVKIAPYAAGSVTSLSNLATHVHLLGIYLSGDWTDAIPVLGPYTLTSQQPYAVAAYSSNANSVTTKKLPSDILSHCFNNAACSPTNGDNIAKCALLDCVDTTLSHSNLYPETAPGYTAGTSLIFALNESSPGTLDPAIPLYYSASTDPWYSIALATPTGTQAITFHAPNAASFAEGVNEGSIAIWDQYAGWAVSLYHYVGGAGGNNLPAASGCGSSSITACPITGNQYQGAASNLFTSFDYGYTCGSSGCIASASSPGFAPFAGALREQELQNGVINHVLLFSIDCGTNSPAYVFPANAAPGICGTGGSAPSASDAYRPSAGALFFTDYTPAQLVTICASVPAWQCTLLTALSAYGAFYTETTLQQGTGMVIHGQENMESGEAWKYSYPSTFLTVDPFWPWITAEKGLNSNGNLTQTGCTAGSGTSAYQCLGGILANIGKLIGPEGADAEGNSCTSGSGCYPSGHLHVADACIAKGYAGVSGGCS